jgi:hypothetical protein
MGYGEGVQSLVHTKYLVHRIYIYILAQVVFAQDELPPLATYPQVRIYLVQTPLAHILHTFPVATAKQFGKRHSN